MLLDIYSGTESWTKKDWAKHELYKLKKEKDILVKKLKLVQKEIDKRNAIIKAKV